KQAIRAAREPPRFREGGGARNRTLCRRRGPAPAVLGRLSPDSDDRGVLAGPSLPSARPRRIPARGRARRLDQEATLPVSWRIFRRSGDRFADKNMRQTDESRALERDRT